MFMGSGTFSLPLEEEDAHGGNCILGEAEASGRSRDEGVGGAGCSMDRAVEERAGRDCTSKEFATVRERRGEEIMNRRLSICLVLSGALVLSAGLAKAQEAVPPPPSEAVVIQGGEPGGDVMFAPFGGPIELLGFEGMHGGKVVTGVPFSAVAVSESTQTLADGNHIARKTETNLFRDSQGRFRKEVTLPAIGPLATSGQPKSFVFINDPVAGTHFILHPDQKTARQIGKPMAGLRGALKEKLGHRMQEANADGNLKKEDLGTQTIAGVSAQGTRITRTIPAGQMGNEKPITITSEHWYSSDLQMVVMSKRSDPRFGDTTYTLTNIQRQEPDASLFAVPSDYTVKQGGMMGRHGMKRFEKAPG